MAGFESTRHLPNRPMMLPPEIIQRFNAAMHEAQLAGEPEPTAMVLGTSDGCGQVTTRTVLLKALDERGFVFFTNAESRKGLQMAECDRAAATFLWKSVLRQVQMEGRVSLISSEEADAYFSTRDRGSQVGAWASLQSRVLDRRETLDQRVLKYEQEFAGREVPRPAYWSGYRLAPDRVEFWHGRAHRLHERLVYRWQDGAWLTEILYP